MACARWRVGVVAVLCGPVVAELQAQVALATGVRASAVGAVGRDRWRADQVVGSTLRFDRPRLALAADGAVLRDDRGVWRTTGSAEAALLTPTLAGARLVLTGSVGQPSRDSAIHPPRMAAGARLSRRAGRTGAWLGADVARSSGSDALPAAELTAGLWRQLTSALVTVSMSSRAGTSRGWAPPRGAVAPADSAYLDSLGTPVSVSPQRTERDTTAAIAARRWSEAEARLLWSGRRWSVDVAVRGRLAAVGVRPALWAAADGAVLVTPRLAIVGGVGTSPGGPTSALPAYRHASLGLRLTRAAPVTRPLPAELQPVAVDFEVRELGPGQYRVAVRVPRARVVELAGNFTAWKPVTLHRAGGDWWEATLPITPGTHQVNVRINGERWLAPPGATVVEDDFAGVVGVIVVR